MMQPPSSLPNLSLPPPGFPPFSSSSDSRQSSGGSQTTPSDANQELWVETKTGDGKVLGVLCILYVLSCICLVLAADSGCFYKYGKIFFCSLVVLSE